MSVENNLITDRTQADVNRWLKLRDTPFDAMTAAEKTEWLSGMKGSYNASDLNRVTDAMVYLANLFRQYGYSVEYDPVIIPHSDGTSDTTWRMTDIPTEEQMQQFLANLHAFWASLESISGSVAESWADTEYGYVDLDKILVTGDYTKITEASGVLTLVVYITSESDLAEIVASGPGWAVETDDDGTTATYRYPNGVFEDLQDALDALTIIRSGDDDFTDASVSVYAEMRSGSRVFLGSGDICWSGVIHWNAFEAYGYTWGDVESRSMTWDGLEHLPMPEGGEE